MKKTMHFLHIILAILTGGLWLIVYAFLLGTRELYNRGYRAGQAQANTRIQELVAQMNNLARGPILTYDRTGKTCAFDYSAEIAASGAHAGEARRGKPLIQNDSWKIRWLGKDPRDPKVRAEMHAAIESLNWIGLRTDEQQAELEYLWRRLQL